MKCELCPSNPGIGVTKLFGVWACSRCLKYVNSLALKNSPPKLPRDKRPQSMKDEGAKYFKSTLQPRREGVASQEYIEAYPEQAKTEFTTKEKLTAKHVWKDVKGWQHRDKSL